MDIWQAQGKAIVVGVLLDGHDKPFLKSVCSLARCLKSPIELVHCLEPPSTYEVDVQKPDSERNNSEAKASMQTLVNSIGAGISIHYHIEQGDPMDHLCRIAEEVSAGMIVCGLRALADRRALKGFSTALSLAFYSPIPVLILPLTAAIDFQEPVNVLISDSFGKTGWQTLEQGLNIARSLDSPLIGHAHIREASPQRDRDERRSAEEALRIQEELFYRFHNTTCSKALLDRYRALVAVGDLETEIDRMIDANHFRLIVVGRGQFHRLKKLALNHLPYRAVAEGKAGLLILTNEDSLSVRGHSKPTSDSIHGAPS